MQLKFDFFYIFLLKVLKGFLMKIIKFSIYLFDLLTKTEILNNK